MPPLAERLRPTILGEIVGQQHLLGPTGPLCRLVERGAVPSMIFWGPAGCGKTTLAHLLGQSSGAAFHSLSAVFSGIQELRHLVQQIEKEREGLFQQPHLLFVDEIHRWNKAQQDALLPYVENGTITLIGATTENPSFEIIHPLLSRTQVYLLHPLDHDALLQLAHRALASLHVTAEPQALTWLIAAADGDARRLITTIDIAAQLHGSDETTPLDLDQFANVLQERRPRYDKSGEEHYHLISALIKSLRASDPDAAIYYLARMYESGEDPRYIARRMVIFAAEDVGDAAPHALTEAVGVFQAFEIIGQAEGWIPLAQGAIRLALAPKSNRCYAAYKAAAADVATHGTLPTPLHLRNAPTALMKALGYGKDYRSPHTDPAGGAAQTYLPDALAGHRYYRREK